HGHRITVLAPEDGYGERLTAAGAGFAPLPMDPKGLSPLANLALLRRFSTANRHFRPDAILSFTIKNNIFGGLAAQLGGIPFLPGVSGLGTAFLSGPSLRVAAESLYRAAFRKAPFVFFENGDD